MSETRTPAWAWICLGVTLGVALSGPAQLFADVPASALTSFVNGTVTDADQVNANFETLRTAHNDLQAQVDAGGGAAAPGILRVLGRAESSTGIQNNAQTWVDVPNTTMTLDVPAGVTTRVAAHGSIIARDYVGTSEKNTHCGFRVVVDGTGYGNPSWGDVIVGCSDVDSSLSEAGWWCPWTISRDLALSAGTHEFKLQMTGWGGSQVSCEIEDQEHARARFDVLAY
jgi:hypothetical protein